MKISQFPLCIYCSAAVLCILAACASEQPEQLPESGLSQSAPSQPEPSVEEILALEDARFRAMATADTLVLDSLLAPDLVYIHSSGTVETKSEFIGKLASGAIDYRSVTIDTIHVRTWPGTAVVTGRADFSVRAGTRELEAPLRFTSVYINRNGRLQLVSWHSVRIPAEKIM